jgi:uncharacterized protein (TIGR01777 family)
MKILISGSSGLVGSALVSSLVSRGDEVIRLVRSEPKGPGEVKWDGPASFIDKAGIEGMDAVVHLAGESLAAGRWSEARKAKIRDSRVKGTRLLAEALAAAEKPPQVFVIASAVGYYGNRGDAILTEDTAAGTGFLAEVCRDWEAATEPAATRGIRVVELRIGMIVTEKGGALPKMMPPFKLGLGGRIGSGLQYISWVALDDVVAIIEFCLASNSLSGPVNTVSPNPVTNSDFTRALGSAVSRPTIFPMPAFAARLAFGEMADAILLSGARVMPEKLTQARFKFKYSDLKAALKQFTK